MIHPDGFNWQFRSSMNFENQHHTLRRDEERKVQCETITNKTNGGYGVGKSKNYFFIDGDEREFLSAEELADAYNEKFKFDEENPEHEVKYVRIVVKKKKDSE